VSEIIDLEAIVSPATGDLHVVLADGNGYVYSENQKWKVFNDTTTRDNGALLYYSYNDISNFLIAITDPSEFTVDKIIYEFSESTVEETFNVTVQNVGGVNVYFIDGVEKPILDLVRGGIYTFDQSDSTNTNHPLRIRDTNDNTFTQGVVATGTPGTASAQVVFTVPNDAPADLKYYCTVHGNGMGNTIQVTDQPKGAR
jgi:hypothetical protein